MSDEINIEASPEIENQITQSEVSESPAVTSAVQNLLERERVLQEHQETLAQREEKAKEAEALLQLAQSDKVALLKQLGLQASDLPALQETLSDPTHDIRQELAEIKQSFSSYLQQQEQAKQASQREQVMNELRSQVSNFVTSETSEFNFIKAHPEGADTVYNYMISRYHDTGKLPSKEEAAREVEGKLKTLIENAQKALSSQDSKPTRPSTLTNADAAAATRTDIKELTREEAIALAAERITNQFRK